MTRTRDDLEEDLRAVLSARDELAPGLDDQLVESLLDRWAANLPRERQRSHKNRSAACLGGLALLLTVSVGGYAAYSATRTPTASSPAPLPVTRPRGTGPLAGWVIPTDMWVTYANQVAFGKDEPRVEQLGYRVHSVSRTRGLIRVRYSRKK